MWRGQLLFVCFYFLLEKKKSHGVHTENPPRSPVDTDSERSIICLLVLACCECQERESSERKREEKAPALSKRCSPVRKIKPGRLGPELHALPPRETNV